MVIITCLYLALVYLLFFEFKLLPWNKISQGLTGAFFGDLSAHTRYWLRHRMIQRTRDDFPCGGYELRDRAGGQIFRARFLSVRSLAACRLTGGLQDA